MSVNVVDKSTGTLANVGSQRIWCGSQSAHDQAEALGKLPNNCLIAITDPASSGMVGEMKIWCGASNNVPSGWLYCDGSAVSRETYSALFDVIGTAFGSGDGSTTFNLPDMREAVPKGAGETGKSVGNHVKSGGLAVGEFLDDRVQSHTHNIKAVAASLTGASYAVGANVNQATMATVSQTGRTGATTEVKSVGVNYIICFR